MDAWCSQTILTWRVSVAIAWRTTDALSRTTSYTLDGWCRVTAVDFPTGTDQTFSYDAESNLTGWTDGVGTWSRTYDDDGRMLTEWSCPKAVETEIS